MSPVGRAWTVREGGVDTSSIIGSEVAISSMRSGLGVVPIDPAASDTLSAIGKKRQQSTLSVGVVAGSGTGDAQ